MTVAIQKRPRGRRASKPSGKNMTVTMNGYRALDRELWGAVAEEITGVLVRKKVQESDEIGRIILKSLFNGKIAQFREYGAQHKTFLALSESSELSPSFLRYAVLIHEQLKIIRRVLGPADDVGEYLSVSVHRKLTTIQDPQVLAMCALDIYNRGLNVEQATAAIYRARGEELEELELEPANSDLPQVPRDDPPAPVGRPRYSELAKGLPVLVKSMSRLLYGGGVEIDQLRLSGKCKLVKIDANVLDGCTPEKIDELKNGLTTLERMSQDLATLWSDLDKLLKAHA